MWEDYRITITNPYGYKEEYHYTGNHVYGWFVAPNNYVPYKSKEQSNFTTPKTRYYYKTLSNNGKIETIQWPLGGGYGYGYDAAGNVSSFSNGLGGVSYQYNTLGKITYLNDELSRVINIAYAANNVDAISATDGLGALTFTYNGTHDITSVTDRLGNTTTLTYNTYGQPTSVTNALGIQTNFVYDASHRLVEVNRAGQRLHSFAYDSLNRVHTYTDPTGLTVAIDYNNLDQITRISYPDGKYTGYQYSSCCPYVVDSVAYRSGQTIFYSYDKLNRLVAVTDPAGGVTRFALDPNGNPVELIDRKGNVTKFKFDNNNRLIKKIYADDEYELYSYYDSGRVRFRKNSRGNISFFGYNGNGDIAVISYDNSSISYYYDTYGRLTSIWNQWGSDYSDFDYSYDANSRLVGVYSNWTPWARSAVTYQYDALGRRTGMTNEGGQIVTYGYDSLDRVRAVNVAGGRYTYAYTGGSPLVQSLTRPNGSSTTYQYDILNRLAQITNSNDLGATISQYAYTYNDQDLRAAESVTEPTALAAYQNAAASYVYNDVNQLLSQSDPGLKPFSYDRDGNLVRGYTPEGYLFTANYDPESHLKTLSYTDSGGIINKTEYYYNGGQLALVKKYQNAVQVSESRYLYDGGLLIQERDANNNLVREYTWGLHMGGGIGGLLNLTQGGDNYSYLYDGKGNVTALLDTAENVAATYQYDPFGVLRAKSGSLNQPMQFSTKPYDSQTGLSQYDYRFYNPSVGRWMTRDPLREYASTNLYGFVQNNPINFIDPLGLVYWDQAGRSLGNLTANVFTLVAGGVVFTGLSVTGVGLVPGSAMVFIGGYGVLANSLNLVAALLEEDPVNKGGFFNDYAAANFPCSKEAQHWATAVDLTFGLVISPFSNGSKLLDLLALSISGDENAQIYRDPKLQNDIRNLW